MRNRAGNLRRGEAKRAKGDDSANRKLPARDRLMQALFLGSFAAGQAPGIARHLEERIEVEILPQDNGPGVPAALGSAEIVVSGAWTRAYPPAPRLAFLQVPLAGIDQVDVAALPKGVAVCNAYGHEPAIGEFAVLAMLAWRHRLFDIALSFRAGSWEWSPLRGGPLRGEIAGATVGIVGLGAIGREVGRRTALLGCRVLAANRTPRETPPFVERLYPLAELDAMLRECDFVVLSCALVPQTKGLIDAARLAAMKRDAYLINLARGPVADEDALYRALADGTIGGAALDTWWRYPDAAEPNPRPSRFPFHELGNVLMTPHCSPWTEATVERRSRDIARNLDRFARGEPVANLLLRT